MKHPPLVEGQWGEKEGKKRKKTPQGTINTAEK